MHIPFYRRKGMSIYARFRPNKKQHLYENPLLLKEGMFLYAHFRPNKKDHLYEKPIVFHCSRFNHPDEVNKMQQKKQK